MKLTLKGAVETAIEAVKELPKIATVFTVITAATAAAANTIPTDTMAPKCAQTEALTQAEIEREAAVKAMQAEFNTAIFSGPQLERRDAQHQKAAELANQREGDLNQTQCIIANELKGTGAIPEIQPIYKDNGETCYGNFCYENPEYEETQADKIAVIKKMIKDLEDNGTTSGELYDSLQQNLAALEK